MAQNFEVIFLGTRPLIDTDTDDEIAENAAALLGTYGSGAAPLASQIQNLTAGDLSEDDNDTYDVDNGGGYDTFRINGGALQNFDAVAIYNATITYVDGTTATVSAVVFQATNGNTYLAPEVSNNADQAALTAKPIQSLQLTSVASNTGDSGGDMAANRIAGDFKGVVDGTAGSDAMYVGYTDAQGDQITATNDAIYGYGGNDTIVGGGGADTIRGGDGNDSIMGDAGTGNVSFGDAGNDTIWNGAGNDSAYGGTGNDLIYADQGSDLLDGGSGDDTFAVNTTFGPYGSDTVIGGETGETQGDLLDFSGMGTGVNLSATGADSGTASDGPSTLNFTEIERFNLSGFADTANLGAMTSPVAINAGAGADTVTGGSGNDTITGGAGNDSLTGGGGNDVYVYNPGDGADVITDFNTGNTGPLNDGDTTNNDFINLSAFYDSVFEIRKDFADDGVLNQSNTSYDFGDNSAFGSGSLTFLSASPASFSTDNTGVACFVRGTMILTPEGEIPIEELRVGMLVTTRDNGPQPIRWTGARYVSPDQIDRSPSLRAIRLRKGLFGGARDLLVSAQHAILLEQGTENLVRATHLASNDWRGARIARGKRELHYHHLMFDRHQIIFAEGVAAESMYPGPLALHGLTPADRINLFAIFPQFEAIRTRRDAERVYGPPARRYIRKLPMQKTRSAKRAVSSSPAAPRAVPRPSTRPEALLHVR